MGKLELDLGCLLCPRGFGPAAVQRPGSVECSDTPTDYRHQHHGRQHGDDGRTVTEDRRGGVDRTDHVGAGQCTLSTQRRGEGPGGTTRDHAFIPTRVLPEPEPDRTVVEVYQTSRPLRPVSSHVRRLSSGHPRNARQPSDHPRRTTEDADDAQFPAIRRCLTYGRVRYNSEFVKKSLFAWNLIVAR